jgi:bifunctional Delta-12/omega-3 fatty acid desaturase
MVWNRSPNILNYSRIPFYHAEEATAAIKPLLGDLYHQEHSFMDKLYPTFRDCKYVEDSAAEPGTMKWATR